MASSVQIYSNGNTSTKTVSVDFVGEILAANFATNVGSTEVEYFFKFQTSARDSANVQLPVKLVLALSDLALNGNVQSASNNSSSYGNVHSMVVDYIYDYINGHIANQYNSGVSAQLPMKFN